MTLVLSFVYICIRNFKMFFLCTANISSCDVDIKFMPSGSMPLVALVSAPGSGNTWLRHLIEKVTGIFTGSIYNDKSLWIGGKSVMVLVA